LSHSEGARVHTHEDHVLFAGSVTLQVNFVGFTGVVQGIINVRNGWVETQSIDSTAQFSTYGNEWVQGEALYQPTLCGAIVVAPGLAPNGQLT
jgi:2-keto-3-deoxy-galactonokinase